MKLQSMISFEEAQKLRLNFLANQSPQIFSGRGIKEYAEFTFNAKELLSYLQLILDHSEGKEPGIRAFLGVYETNDKNETTLFFAPTKEVSAESEVDYTLEPLNRGFTGWPPCKY